MKAVRSDAGGVTVVDVDDPPGTGERIAMKATSRRASVPPPRCTSNSGAADAFRVAGDKASDAIRVIIEPT